MHAEFEPDPKRRAQVVTLERSLMVELLQASHLNNADRFIRAKSGRCRNAQHCYRRVCRRSDRRAVDCRPWRFFDNQAVDGIAIAAGIYPAPKLYAAAKASDYFADHRGLGLWHSGERTGRDRPRSDRKVLATDWQSFAIQARRFWPSRAAGFSKRGLELQLKRRQARSHGLVYWNPGRLWWWREPAEVSHLLVLCATVQRAHSAFDAEGGANGGDALARPWGRAHSRLWWSPPLWSG